MTPVSYGPLNQVNVQVVPRREVGRSTLALPPARPCSLLRCGSPTDTPLSDISSYLHHAVYKAVPRTMSSRTVSEVAAALCKSVHSDLSCTNGLMPDSTSQPCIQVTEKAHPM